MSVNPIALLFSNFDIAAEYRMSPDIGLELSPGISFNNSTVNGDEYKSTGFGARLIGKYYFNPEDGCDKWNIGPYIKYGSATLKYNDGNTDHKVSSTRLAVGFYTGYKWVSRKNVVFELGFGVGKAFVNKYTTDDSTVNIGDFADLFNIDFTGKLAVGYRFGGK